MKRHPPLPESTANGPNGRSYLVEHNGKPNPAQAAAGATSLGTWLDYARKGVPIVPEHNPDPSSPTGCDCPRPDCTKPGKHPRTNNGSLDATTNTATVERWHRTWPGSNIGTALEKIDAVVVAPDSPEWLEEFKRRGLPPTATATSGGGEGHLHFWYRLPKGGPQARICKPGQYDILSKGNVILPPSLHPSGERREWVVPFESVDRLAEAPPWAIDELRQHVDRRRPAEAHSGGEDEPPVLLDDYGLKVWRGELPKRKPDGAVDRSGTLLKIGRVLYDAGATGRTIVAELADLDERLGYRKYTDRPDADKQYRAIVDELEREGRTPRAELAWATAPDGHAGNPETGDDGAEECLDCARLKAENARLAAENEQLRRERAEERELRRLETSIIARPKGEGINPNRRLPFLLFARRYFSDVGRDRLQPERRPILDEEGWDNIPLQSWSNEVGIGYGAALKVRAELAEHGVIETREDVEWTDDGKRITRTAVRPTARTLKEMVAQLATVVQAPTGWGGKREWRCKACRGAEIVVKRVCARCGADAEPVDQTDLQDENRSYPQDEDSLPPSQTVVRTNDDDLENRSRLERQARARDGARRDVEALIAGRAADVQDENRSALEAQLNGRHGVSAPDLEALAALAERRGWAALETRHGTTGGTEEAWRKFLSLPPPWLPQVLPEVLVALEAGP